MRKHLTFLLLLYLFLDFSTPFLPGSFEFSPETSETALHRIPQREMRPLAMAVERMNLSADIDRPALSRSQLLIRQTLRRSSWTTAPPLRSRSGPSVDTAGEDD
jgi:hypothetical protein